MQKRIVTGTLVLAVVLALFFINSYLLNFIFIGIVLYFAFSESLKLYEIDDARLVWIALAFYTLTFFTNPIFIAMLAVILIASVLAHIQAQNLRIIAPFLYPTTPIFMLWMLYSEYGVGYLAWLVLSVAASDTGAYFVGKFYGKRKFSQTSPNKTWEGVVGGIAIGTFVGAICASFVVEGFLRAFYASFLVCAFAIWGDLFESYLKRVAGVKDSGSILPGHGGMLDRIDGYLFGVVAMLWALSW